MILTKQDFEDFKQWLDLDVNSIAWEGRYADSFTQFWNSFFKDQIKAMELSERFDYAKKLAKSGPLISWLNWLFEKFLIFTFVRLGKSVREISLQFDLPENYISTTLRDYMIKVYPSFEDFINDNFQISNVSSKNLFLKFKDIQNILGDEALNRGTFEDDILAHMEVTLYPEWSLLVKELKKDLTILKLDFEKLKRKSSFKKQIRFLQEVIILLVILTALVFALKNTNKWYEDYLVNKITLFEPNFFWLDKSLTYQDQDLLAKQQIDLSNKELEELERLEAQSVFDDSRPESRYDPESDVVVLSSVDDVPKSFVEAETEQSDYEENKKGGYRDNSYAVSNKKAYRIMMSSVGPSSLRDEILALMKKYEISQVDNVRPGTQIPGGIYFNLHVPSRNLKEFISKLSSISEATIFESRSEGADKPGRNRVFIWIKSI